jgi:hypothetical protein
LPSLSLFKISAAILAQAKDLLGGDSSDAPARHDESSFTSTSDAGHKQDTAALDETFWTTLVGDERRLAALRRAIDEAAAEAMAGETQADLSPSPAAQLSESRWEAANRKITEALKAERR